VARLDSYQSVVCQLSALVQLLTAQGMLNELQMQVELYRTGLLPPPSIQSLLLPPAPLQAPPVPQKQQQRQQQQQQQELSSSTTSQQGVRGPSHTMAPTTVSASVSAAAQVAGGLDGAAAAGCASAAATGTGEGKHASKNRKRRERERAAKAAAAVAAAAAGEVPAGWAVGNVLEQLRDASVAV